MQSLNLAMETFLPDISKLCTNVFVILFLGISKFQHFWVLESGSVEAAATPNGTRVTFCLLKQNSVPPTTTPEALPSAGLSDERRKYRFKKLRQYFSARNKDLMCPQ